MINVDTDGNGIPDINIDTNGNMKADINISKDGITPTLNLLDIENWLPDKDYTYKKFNYDTMKDLIPLINIDTDGDGRPDVNVDIDGDGIPDINIDVNHDGIPDVDIDSDGDGIPDVNIDTDGDGKPDENIKEITEWKPDKNVDGEFPFDTMTFDESEEPNKPDEPKDPNQKVHDTDVKGTYYPGDSVGGALTGDETNKILLASVMLSAFGLINYLCFKYKKDTFQ